MNKTKNLNRDYFLFSFLVLFTLQSTLFASNENCDSLQFNGGTSQITLIGLSPASKVEIIGSNTNWQIVPICNGNCTDTLTIPNLSEGEYSIKVNLSDGTNYCYREEKVMVSGSEIPSGGSANCNQITFQGVNNQIIIEGLTASFNKVEILGRNTDWQVIPVCDGDCPDTLVIPDLAKGNYAVKINQSGNDGSYCYREEQITVTEGEIPQNPLPCQLMILNGKVPDTIRPSETITVSATIQNTGTFTTQETILGLYQFDQGGNSFLPLPSLRGQGIIPSLAPDEITEIAFEVAMPEDLRNEPIPNILIPFNWELIIKDEADTYTPFERGESCPLPIDFAIGLPITNLSSCDAFQFSVESGQITIGGLTNPSKLEIIGSNTNWEVISICENDCDATQVIADLLTGEYVVKVSQADGEDAFCYQETKILVENGSDNRNKNRESGSDLILYPNPARDKISIQLYNADFQKGTIYIYNVFGQQVLNIAYDQINQVAPPISLNGFENGIYLLSLQIGSRKILNKRFVVEHLR